MNGAPNSSRSISPSLLARCGQCGYWLRGLPRDGVCPECWTAYRGSRICLLGWARGSHANILTASNGGMIYYVLFLILIGRPLDLLRTLQALPVITSQTLIALLAVVVPIAVALGLRAYSLHRETTLCELCAKGVRQDAFGRSRLLSVMASAILFLPIVASNLTFGLASRQPSLVILVVAMLALLALLFALLARRHSGAMATLTPWTDAASVRFGRLRNRRCHLEIARKRSCSRFLDLPEIVCAEFDLSEEQEAELRDRLSEWQALVIDSDPPAKPSRMERLARSLGRMLGRAFKAIRM